MDTTWLDGVLQQTLEDVRMSRAERHALAGVLDDLIRREGDIAVVRSRAFALAAQAVPTRHGRQVLDWLEELVKVIESARGAPPPKVRSEALFSPGETCLNRLVGLIGGCSNSLEVCVYTITDDRISEALLTAHRRGVAIRIITDDVKSGDLGSDVDRLEAAGIPLAVDRGPGHMHHKFAVFDRRTLAAGSYNWTRSAAEENHEDLVVSNNSELLSRFSAEFERLWELFRE